MSSYRGPEVYRPPPERRCNHDTDASAGVWALGCIFLEVLAWYFQPTGCTPQGFHYSRVQTIREDGGTEAKDLTSARFWALDCRARPVLHPSVKQWSIDIKVLAESSKWLFDVPNHVERLLSIRSEARFTASDFGKILQYSLVLKKLALGDSLSPFAVLNGGLLPKADFSLDVLGGFPTITDVQQMETAQTRSVSISHPLSCEILCEQSARTAKGPGLWKSGKWTRDEVRNRCYEH